MSNCRSILIVSKFLGMGGSIMAIDYSLLLTLKSMFRDGKYGREHNKHDFDADYNKFQHFLAMVF